MEHLNSLEELVKTEIRVLKRCLEGLPDDSSSVQSFSCQLVAFSIVLGFIDDIKSRERKVA